MQSSLVIEIFVVILTAAAVEYAYESPIVSPILKNIYIIIIM